MDDPTKRNVLFVAAVAAAVLSIYFWGAEQRGIAVSEVVPQATDIEGEVLSVKTTGAESSEPGEALVRLTSGETVRAYVPPACVIFPGQIAFLSRVGAHGAKDAYYFLSGAKEM